MKFLFFLLLLFVLIIAIGTANATTGIMTVHNTVPLDGLTLFLRTLGL